MILVMFIDTANNILVYIIREYWGVVINRVVGTKFWCEQQAAFYCHRVLTSSGSSHQPTSARPPPLIYYCETANLHQSMYNARTPPTPFCLEYKLNRNHFLLITFLHVGVYMKCITFAALGFEMCDSHPEWGFALVSRHDNIRVFSSLIHFNVCLRLLFLNRGTKFPLLNVNFDITKLAWAWFSIF